MSDPTIPERYRDGGQRERLARLRVDLAAGGPLSTRTEFPDSARIAGGYLTHAQVLERAAAFRAGWEARAELERLGAAVRGALAGLAAALAVRPTGAEIPLPGDAQ